AVAVQNTMPEETGAIDEPEFQLVSQMGATNTAGAEAHESFLRFAGNLTQVFSEQLAWQMALLQAGPQGEGLDSIGFPTAGINPAAHLVRATRPVRWDRDQCLEFAGGQIGRVLGPDYREIDSFPTRVRLPDEPLMLADRILSVEGEPLSLTCGR